jgi:glycosyltransferase involved in cell wall biosynthesis
MSRTADPSGLDTERQEVLPRRVAIFSDSFPERNGAGAYYSDLVEQLQDKVEAIELFQPLTKKRMLRFALPLPGDRTQKLITPNVFRLRRQFKALRPHLVVAVTPGPFGMVGMFLARRAKTGFLTGFHTHFEGLMQLYGDTLFYKTAYLYLRQINRILCRRSDSVLINNGDLVATVKDLGAPRTDIMGTPLATEFIKPELVPPRGKLEQVLFAGRLAPEKNIPAILEAVRACPHLRFVMAGDGPLRKEVEDVAKDYGNLRLTGWLDRPALRREVDAADLLLLPSHMETFGTVALEAMARGRPAAVAANAGIHHWEILKEALITLEPNQPIATSLAQMEVTPPEVWHARASAARQAAEALNAQTLEHWMDFIERYSRDS